MLTILKDSLIPLNSSLSQWEALYLILNQNIPFPIFKGLKAKEGMISLREEGSRMAPSP